VTTPPIQVRIGSAFGRLVSVSATGALMQGPQALSPEREWRVFLDLEPERVELRARVTRYDPVSLSGATWQRQEYALGIAFTDLPPKAEAALKTLCGEMFAEQE
jgi:hypothetical protein